MSTKSLITELPRIVSEGNREASRLHTKPHGIMQIHIGHIIRDELHRQGRTNQWLADQLSVERSTVQRLFNKPSIDTLQLFRISKLLETDFFVCYSRLFAM